MISARLVCSLALLLAACGVEAPQADAEAPTDEAAISYPGYRGQPARPTAPFCEPGCGRGTDFKCWGTCPSAPASGGGALPAWLPAGKTAALSITIDDNHARDHAFWQDLARRTGTRYTWFIITGRIADVRGSTTGVTGVWDDFKALAQSGHEIGSHSHSHDVNIADIAGDVRRSNALIQQKLGVTARSFSFVDPTQDPRNRWKPVIAAMHYAGTRGTAAALVGADQNANSYSTGAGLSLDQLVATHGWAVVHFHNMTPAHKASVEALIRDAQRRNIWIAPFGTVATAYPN